MINEILKAVRKIKVGGNSTKALLEYYLVENGEDKYGLKVSKKTDGVLKVSEQRTLEYISDEEREADKVIKLLARNTVTPLTVENVLHDLGYVVWYIYFPFNWDVKNLF